MCFFQQEKFIVSIKAEVTMYVFYMEELCKFRYGKIIPSNFKP